MMIIGPRLKKALESGLLPVFKRSTGNSQDTLDAWTGGGFYIHLFTFELFGLKIEFWRKNK